MQYDVKNPEAYLELLEDDWRKEKVMEIRSLLHDIAPELVEGIEYKMLCYRLQEETVFCLNAQKAYVSLYIGDINKVDGAEELLKPFNLGKGCIRIKKSINLSETKLSQFIERAWGKVKIGGDIGC